MGISLPSIIWPTWTRNVQGENFYDLKAFDDWGLKGSNLEIAQNHPILTPAILFVSKIFSQASFTVVRNSTDKKIDDHWLLSLLKKPNPYQTQQDFLETLMFMQIAQGVCVVYMKRIIGFQKPKQLYVLDYNLIEFSNKIKNGVTKQISSNIMNEYVKYDRNGENLDIQLKDLLFLYDLPNCLSKNPFNVKSRLHGLKQTLINTNDSLLAKNIILKTNGKELITGKKEGFPLDDDEKVNIESLWNNSFGLGFNRKRGVVTKSDLTWKSLHIALRDLGLDESVKVDGNLIYTALHIPKDILSLEAKKTTYNNFKESMVSYIQNEMQASLNSFVATLSTIVEDNVTLKGSYEHMPIMQFVLIERYKGVEGQATALKALLLTGIPKEIALEMTGFEKTLDLDLSMLKNDTNGQEQQTETTANTSSEG
jgi:hypothetical protein